MLDIDMRTLRPCCTLLFFPLQREEPVKERPFRAVKSECLEDAL